MTLMKCKVFASKRTSFLKKYKLQSHKKAFLKTLHLWRKPVTKKFLTKSKNEMKVEQGQECFSQKLSTCAGNM